MKLLSHTYLYLVALFLKIRKISKVSDIFCLFLIKFFHGKAQIKKTIFLSTNKEISTALGKNVFIKNILLLSYPSW